MKTQNLFINLLRVVEGFLPFLLEKTLYSCWGQAVTVWHKSTEWKCLQLPFCSKVILARSRGEVLWVSGTQLLLGTGWEQEISQSGMAAKSLREVCSPSWGSGTHCPASSTPAGAGHGGSASPREGGEAFQGGKVEKGAFRCSFHTVWRGMLSVLSTDFTHPALCAFLVPPFSLPPFAL